jgi:hypothetical protein
MVPSNLSLAVTAFQYVEELASDIPRKLVPRPTTIQKSNTGSEGYAPENGRDRIGLMRHQGPNQESYRVSKICQQTDAQGDQNDATNRSRFHMRPLFHEQLDKVAGLNVQGVLQQLSYSTNRKSFDMWINPGICPPSS